MLSCQHIGLLLLGNDVLCGCCYFLLSIAPVINIVCTYLLVENAFREDELSVGLPTIPVQPIGYDDAKTLLG